MAHEERFQTLHPDPEKSGPRIARAKYDRFREAILASIPAGPEGIPFGELPRRVRERLPEGVRETIGSIPWYTVTIKLDLEARGEIERVPGARPQRVRRVR